jgi:hypothetical protein
MMMMRNFKKGTLAAGAGVAAAGCALAGFAVSPALAGTSKPANVKGLAVKNGSVTTDGATLAWSKDTGAADYRVVVVNASTPTAGASYDSGNKLTGTSVTIHSLAAGTAYEAKILAGNSAGTSDWSTWVFFYTDAAAGAAGTPILFESTGNSTPDLAIDMAPGPQGLAGSGGWGWDESANKPVTDLTVGAAATFTATVVQPNTETADGSLTLTYDPYDFRLTTPPADGTCSVIAQTSQETCTFTDLAHSAASKGFVFTPQHADPDATIGLTAVVAGEEATAQFPVQISAAAP